MAFKLVLLLACMAISSVQSAPNPQKIGGSIDIPSQSATIKGGIDRSYTSGNGRHIVNGGAYVAHTFPINQIRNGRTNVGANVDYGYQNGGHSVHAWASTQKPFQNNQFHVGANVDYGYKNGGHSVHAGASAHQSFQNGRGGKPYYGANVGYTYQLGK